MTLNIKTAREALGLSQEALAERMGLVQSTVCLWEKGKRVPKRPTLFFIEEMLKSAGLDPADFSTGEAS
jgi:transcriptional regulator with XRE-family HTH domain